jgi:hypothetical protein
VGPGLVESAAAELTDQEGQIARHVVGDLARPPGVPESEMFALVDQAEKGGLVGGAPDPQAAGAAARMTAKIAVNGRTGAPGIPVGRRPDSGFRAAPVRGRPGNSAVHGWIRLIRVAQLASAVRVPPQLPNGVASYSARVQVCAMYSAAIQMFVPSTAVAP